MNNAAGAALQITRLYNSEVERLKEEEDWPPVWLAFICDLCKLGNEQGVLYLHDALGARQSRRGFGVEIASGDDL